MGALRAGVIGFGSMGRNHARVLWALPGVDLVVIADPNGDPAGTAPAPLVRTVEDAVAIGLDFAIVATPASLHLAVCEVLAESSVPTLVEKPLASSLIDAENLADLYEMRGVFGCVGHIERYNPANRALRSCLASGTFGDIYQIATRRIGPYPERIVDVGVVMDLATHDIDLAAWLAGEDFAKVTGLCASRAGSGCREDLVSVMGLLENGTITNHIVNRVSTLKERCTIVTCARGLLVSDMMSPRLTLYPSDHGTPFPGAGVRRFEIPLERDSGGLIRDSLLCEIDTFRRAVSGEEADIVTLSEGVRAVRVADSIIRSCIIGMTLDVRPDVPRPGQSP